MRLKPLDWKENKGSCGWWPFDWRDVVGNDAPVYWQTYALGLRAQIIERDRTPAYWLHIEGIGQPVPIFFNTLSAAKNNFSYVLLAHIENHVI